jgi:nucleoside-diphosphate-sugar epimerase
MPKILVTGAFGQIGSELVSFLQNKFGTDSVIATDIHLPKNFVGNAEILDVCDAKRYRQFVIDNKIDTIYHLASLISVGSEANPDLAWTLNLGSLKTMLDIARDHKIKCFWPSSIAAFGKKSLYDPTPQHNILEPTTIYGVTKVAGELLCQYYFLRYGVDVRSVRYPGIIQYKGELGNGTTEYAIAIFYEALKTGIFTCFLKENAKLPMMFIDDAIAATIGIMDADINKIKIRTSYNLSAISFSPKELVAEIRKNIPLEVKYEPDHHKDIADTWPKTIDDSEARSDWGWKHTVDLTKMVEIMLKEVGKKVGVRHGKK